MKLQSIQSYRPSFRALILTPEARAIIEREEGGKERTDLYTKELANSKADLTIKTSEYKGNVTLFPYFGDRRYCSVLPARVDEKYVMVYSGDSVFRDNESDIVDCLKFKSAKRAKEVYNKLKSFASNRGKSVLNDLDWHVYAMKLYDEAEIVPQKNSPWSMWSQNDRITPMESYRKPDKVALEEENKPSFTQKLKEAWKILTK